MNILDIFYKNIVKEAARGRINCLNYYNIIFETKIKEENIYIKSNEENENIYVPTLNIKDKKTFDRLLVEYVNNALDFYDDDNFDSDILDYKEYDEENKICKEKAILALLFSNATVEDFNNPIDFLRKRIKFMKLNEEENISYSKILDSDIILTIKKDNIMNETPYMLQIKIVNNDEFELPQVKFGIYNNKLYIYAIQNKNKNITNFMKKIRRKLYKVNENFDSEDNFENYEEGNLKDITPSTLLSANIAIFFLQKFGINEVIIPSILIERWNAKKIALQIRCKRKNLDLEEEIKKQDLIQSNLTEKLIRTFLRLDYHHESLNTISLPMGIDSCIHLKVDNNINCNNSLLDETANLISNVRRK